MRLTRRNFLVWSGLCAMEIALELQGHGVVAVVTAAIPRLLETVSNSESVDIRKTELDAVYGFFTPGLRSYLRSIPVMVHHATRTAACYPNGLPGRPPFIAVSPDFFRAAGQSPYWQEYYSKPPYSFGYDQPVFDEEFRINLLAHELLHMAEVHLKLDMARFLDDVEHWYRDEVYGTPTQDDGSNSGQGEANRIKHILWWYLYGRPGDSVDNTDGDWRRMEYCDYYRHSLRGSEEFAFIGTAILVPTDDDNRRDRLRDLSDDIIDCYGGILDVSTLECRPSADRIDGTGHLAKPKPVYWGSNQ